jgi:hypothetical protein
MCEELRQLAERWAEADRRAWAATVAEQAGDREPAEDARREAAGDHQALSADLADLYLLLQRHAEEHRADTLRLSIVQLLAGDREALRALGRLIREAEEVARG